MALSVPNPTRERRTRSTPNPRGTGRVRLNPRVRVYPHTSDVNILSYLVQFLLFVTQSNSAEIDFEFDYACWIWSSFIIWFVSFIFQLHQVCVHLLWWFTFEDISYCKFPTGSKQISYRILIKLIRFYFLHTEKIVHQILRKSKLMLWLFPQVTLVTFLWVSGDKPQLECPCFT